MIENSRPTELEQQSTRGTVFDGGLTESKVGTSLPHILPPVTADFLWNDNHSNDAEANREALQETIDGGQVENTIDCSDSRVRVPRKRRSRVIHTIATGGTRQLYQKLLDHRTTRATANLAHLNGISVEEALQKDDITIEDITKDGCGGLNLKQLLEAGAVTEAAPGSIRGFAKEKIFHSDPVVQTYLASLELAQMTETPVAAMVEDHISGEIKLIAAQQRKNGTMYVARNSRLDPRYLSPELYDPNRIYEGGLPTINPDDLPDNFAVFRDYIQSQKEEIAVLKERHPDFERMNRVQNQVRAVLWTTNPWHQGNRFPELSDIPGALFVVSSARQKEMLPTAKDQMRKEVQISQTALNEGIEQIEYPLTEAVAHHLQPERAFSQTSSLIIETSSRAASASLLEGALKEDFFHEWMNISGNKVYLLKTAAGEIQDIHEFQKFQPTLA